MELFNQGGVQIEFSTSHSLLSSVLCSASESFLPKAVHVCVCMFQCL